MHSEIQAARASGMSHLWHTDFKTQELAEVLQDISRLRPADAGWTPGDTPGPRPGNPEPARICFVTCDRKGLRFVVKAQYHFAQQRWFFDDPPSGAIKIVAWMDAPPPFLGDRSVETKPANAAESSALCAG